MGRIDLSNYNIRTDLIIDDNKLEHFEKNIDNILVTTTKKNGNYVTITFDDITNFEDREKVGRVLQDVIIDILKLNNIKEDDSCLIVGLGNRLSTPDSLGPKTLDSIVITNHLFDIEGDIKGMRRVSSLAPGVSANTGMDSSVIIKAIVEKTKPDFIIAIDALASRDIDRINKTIQVTDTGIHPGSGVGNNRTAITKETEGIPVIAIGVPTVTSSDVIVIDTIDYLFKHISYIKKNTDTYKLSFKKRNYKKILDEMELDLKDRTNLLGLFGSLSEIDKRDLINEVLTNTNLNLIVTPTEIDFLIDKLSNLIASGINNSLHRQINHF